MTFKRTSRLARREWTVRVRHQLAVQSADVAITGSSRSQPWLSSTQLQPAVIWQPFIDLLLGSLDAPDRIPRGSVNCFTWSTEPSTVTHHLTHCEDRS